MVSHTRRRSWDRSHSATLATFYLSSKIVILLLFHPVGAKTSISQMLQGLASEWPEAARRVHPVVLWLYRARDQLYDDLAAVLAPFDLLPADFDVLAALRTQPHPHTLTPTVLYRSLLLSSGGLTKILHRLEARGLVTRPPNPADRRSRLVRLSPRGQRFLQEALDDVIAHEERFLAPLDAAETRELTRLLSKLVP